MSAGTDSTIAGHSTKWSFTTHFFATYFLKRKLTVLPISNLLAFYLFLYCELHLAVINLFDS
jgi:hypothetical protein